MILNKPQASKKTFNMQVFQKFPKYLEVCSMRAELKFLIDIEELNKEILSLQCCRCPEGCSVVSLINSLSLTCQWTMVQMLLYVHTHTKQDTKLAEHIPPSFPTCDPTCVSICRGDMPVVLVRSQHVSSTISQLPSMSLSAVCPPQ